MTDDIIIRKDGNQYMCILGDFTDLPNSPSWWGGTPLLALASYCKDCDKLDTMTEVNEPAPAILNNINQVLWFYLGEESETAKELIKDIKRYAKTYAAEQADNETL